MKREVFIDYARAIMIFWVVFHHIVSVDVVTHSMYFAMPAFFLITGYMHVRKKDTLSNLIYKKIKNLLLPFWSLMFFSGLVELFRGSYFGYADYKTVISTTLVYMFYGSPNLPKLNFLTKFIKMPTYVDFGEKSIDVMLPLNCHLWFFVAMFVGSILFYIYLEKIRKQDWHDFIMIFICLLIACVDVVLGFQLPYCLSIGGYVCACMIVGYRFKQRDVFKINTRHSIACAICAALYIAFLISGQTDIYLNMSFYGSYGTASVFASFLYGISGTYLLFYLMKLLESIAPNVEVLKYFGQRTLVLYIWHLYVCTLVYFIMAIVFKMTPEISDYGVNVIPNDRLDLKLIAFVATIFLCAPIIDKIRSKLKKTRLVA